MDAVKGIFQIYKIHVYLGVPLDTLLKDIPERDIFEQCIKMPKITKSTGDVQYSCIFDFMIWNCRYFEALAKGETPPVKDRLEFQLGQPMERPLTQGLLAVLHKQVSKNHH